MRNLLHHITKGRKCLHQRENKYKNPDNTEVKTHTHTHKPLLYALSDPTFWHHVWALRSFRHSGCKQTFNHNRDLAPLPVCSCCFPAKFVIQSAATICITLKLLLLKLSSSSSPLCCPNGNNRHRVVQQHGNVFLS